jgi:CRP-like cAMP-binding protein
MKIVDFSLDLIAQLFNPDRLIREVAAWALFQIDPESYRSNVARLEEQTRRKIDEVILDRGDQSSLMVFEKILFYQQISFFEGIPGITLSFLADISDEVKLHAQHSLSIDEKFNNSFYVIYSGSVKYYVKGNYEMDFNKGQFVGEMLSAPGFANTNLVVANEETVLLKINKDLFYELVSDNVKLADKVLEYI